MLNASVISWEHPLILQRLSVAILWNNQNTRQLNIKLLMVNQWELSHLICLKSGFSFPGELNLAQSNLLTTLPSIGKEYHVSFDMLVTKHKLVDWRNVIHFTIGGNYGTYGERTPGVWIFRNNKLWIISALNGNHNHHYEWPAAVVEGEWNNIQIYQTMRNNKAGDNKRIFRLEARNILKSLQQTILNVVSLFSTYMKSKSMAKSC
jgi:hypothetical protein